MAFSDPSHDIDHLITEAMGSAVEGASRALAEQIRRRGEAQRREARAAALSTLRDACARLDATRTQVETLTALVEEAARFASRTALLLTFVDGVRGWAAHGLESDSIERLALSYDDEPTLATFAQGRGTVTLDAGASAAFARRLGAPAPVEAVLVPLVLRDRTAAALYADRAGNESELALAALQLLVFTAAQVLELQGMRQRAATPTLHGADREPAMAALPLWDPRAAVEPAPAPQPAPAPPAPAPPAPSLQPAPSFEPEQSLEPEEPTAVTTVGGAWSPREPAAAPAPAPAPAPWEEPTEVPWSATTEPEPAWEAAPEPPPAELPAFAAEPLAVEEPAWTVEPEPPAFEEPVLEEPLAEVEPAWSYEPAAIGEDAAVEATSEVVEVTAEPALEAYDEVEEVGATAVEELPVEPVSEEPAWKSPDAEPTPWYRPAPAAPPPPIQTSPWQIQPAAPPTSPPAPVADSTTSTLYPAAPGLGPAEATVRISRDLLPTAAPPPSPPPAPEPVPDLAEAPTALLDRSALPPVSDVERTRPTPTVPEPVAPPPRPSPLSLGGGGSTEVQPPPDLEGPGWAFRGDASAGQAAYRAQNEESSAMHEEARRLARLLVSEIKLYNEEQVEEGRRNHDIYPRLQDDIDRSRQMYEDRVDPRVRGEVDYFHQEMVNILAAGDASALGV
jgi:hypothetical protein